MQIKNITFPSYLLYLPYMTSGDQVYMVRLTCSSLSDSIQVSQCIPWLAKLLYHGDKEVLSNCLWSVAFLGMHKKIG